MNFRNKALALILLALAGCERSGPIPEGVRRKYYGDSFIYPGAPFICVYVGLDTNETASFETAFWRFARAHDIHKPKKNYRAYSGPPLARAKSDHVSVYVSSSPTADFVRRKDSDPGEPIDWRMGIWRDSYWPTNASLARKNGQEVLAPFTGKIGMASNDTNYSVGDFKRLSEALVTSLQSAFPDRVVRVFSYDGDTNEK